MGSSWIKRNDDGSLSPESKAFQKKYLSGKQKPFGAKPKTSSGTVAEKGSDTGGGQNSSSTTMDFSAVDEGRKLRGKAGEMHGAAASAAYSGDVPKAMAAGHAIRALKKQASAAEAQGPRVRSQQSSHTAPNQKSSVKFHPKGH